MERGKESFKAKNSRKMNRGQILSMTQNEVVSSAQFIKQAYFWLVFESNDLKVM